MTAPTLAAGAASLPPEGEQLAPRGGPSAFALAKGRCHCGAVRFEVDLPSRFVAHCHCESCRRAHGAAFVTWAGFKSPQVRVTQGAADLSTHESSPRTFRRFCKRCGTKLFFESAKWPGETHVVLAAFDDPVDRPPSGHAFYEEHASWLPPLAEMKAPTLAAQAASLPPEGAQSTARDGPSPRTPA